MRTLYLNEHDQSACLNEYAAREFVNKSAASAASPDYVKFQAVIKSKVETLFLCCHVEQKSMLNAHAQ